VRLTARQREVLRILDDLGGSDGWGEVWTHYTWSEGAQPLAMKNFDRVTDSLVRYGLISTEREGYPYFDLTDAGREALKVTP
jgi:hypothetical protein